MSAPLVIVGTVLTIAAGRLSLSSAKVRVIIRFALPRRPAVMIAVEVHHTLDQLNIEKTGPPYLGWYIYQLKAAPHRLTGCVGRLAVWRL